MLLRLALCALLAAFAHCQEYRDVYTPQGPVRGYREDDIFVFYSVPYATAPTGVDKFKAPLDAPMWTQIFEAIDKGIICYQNGPLAPVTHKAIKSKTQREDCLLATVYIPDTTQRDLPVVVYIHGGEYHYGFGDVASPKSLVGSKRVVAVTFNYRLGIHGFLCLGTSGAPGNAGMKDMVALLRWVKRNIAGYGGNPNDVTVAGYSTGAIAVDLMLLSKTAKGLFNKVIPESGISLSTFSVQLDPVKIAKTFARKQGFTDVDNLKALEKFYINATVGLLLTPDAVGFGPCIEQGTGDEKFLDDLPVKILKDGRYIKVPMLYGVTRQEGIFYLKYFLERIAKMSDKFSDFLPYHLQFDNEAQKEQIALEVKRFYFGDNPLNNNSIYSYIDYHTDIMFAFPILRSVKLQVEAGNTEIYLYEYSFVAEEISYSVGNLKVYGSYHCAQTFIILNWLPLIYHANRTLKFQTMMRELWLNFITTGSPVHEGSSIPAWPPVGANGSPYMNLDETPQLNETPLQWRPRLKFWDDIYDRYYHTPAPLDAPVWTQTFDAVDKEIICPQVDTPKPLLFKHQQEDCLFATIYVPDTTDRILPVAVFVHGGGYHQGSDGFRSPRSLVGSKRVVAVTFNYRLGIHGFLCLGTSGAPGNAGMKDIVALLGWVNKSIASYGGNPNDVTIVGFSAGASAVDLVMLSEAATGLYNKVIPESGSSVGVFSVQIDAIQIAKDYARLKSFTDIDDIEALEGFYTNATMDQLTNFDFMNRTDSSLGFVPCIEKDIGEVRFLEDSPVNIMKEGRYIKVPMLYGFTQMDGLFRISKFYEWSARMNEKFSDFLPADLQFDNEAQKEQVAQEVKNFYFGDQTVNENTVYSFVDYFTDIMFAYPILRSVKLQVKAGNTNIYLYEYTFIAEELPSALVNLEVYGANHCAQTYIVLNSKNLTYHANRTLQFQAMMRELWLNFITTGSPVHESSPVPAWPPVGENRSPHMVLDATPQLGGALLQRRASFWDAIYDRHYRTPVAPSSASFAHIHSLLSLAFVFTTTTTLYFVYH